VFAKYARGTGEAGVGKSGRTGTSGRPYTLHPTPYTLHPTPRQKTYLMRNFQEASCVDGGGARPEAAAGKSCQ